MKLKQSVKSTLVLLILLGYLIYAIDYSQRVTKEEWKQTVLENEY